MEYIHSALLVEFLQGCRCLFRISKICNSILMYVCICWWEKEPPLRQIYFSCSASFNVQISIRERCTFIAVYSETQDAENGYPGD